MIFTFSKSLKSKSPEKYFSRELRADLTKKSTKALYAYCTSILTTGAQKTVLRCTFQGTHDEKYRSYLASKVALFTVFSSSELVSSFFREENFLNFR